jgi:hypothetical protein
VIKHTVDEQACRPINYKENPPRSQQMLEMVLSLQLIIFLLILAGRETIP